MTSPRGPSGQPLTDREVVTIGRDGKKLFPGGIDDRIVLPAAAASLVLPSVTIASGALPSGITITRVFAAVSWRKQVDSSAALNAINNAQQIQVRDDSPGTFRNAITIPDNALETASSATEGGIVLFGAADISVEVDGDDIYEFQWQNAQVDGASLTLHDFQTFLIVEYI